MKKSLMQSGRSMVEMLGVLAIIGVLSVGGLAGYSMAMNKYKIIKQRDQLIRIMAGASTLFGGDLYKHFENTDSHTHINDILKDSNIISSDEYIDNSYIKDVYGNPMQIYVDSHNGYNPDVARNYLHIEFVIKDIDKNFCVDMLSSPAWSGYHYHSSPGDRGSFVGTTPNERIAQGCSFTGKSELYLGYFLE